VTEPLDLDAIRAWISETVGAAVTLEPEKVRPWATVLRVRAAGRTVWFKACQPVQAFEPRLTATLASRWPDRLPRVLAVDEARAWLLTADAGASIGSLGNAPEIWMRALPRHAEMQLGETGHVRDHLAHGVPDLRLAHLPDEFVRLLSSPLPLDADERQRLAGLHGGFARRCDDLAAVGLGDSIQHDDLHVNGLFVRGDELRFLDWGDASIGYPFFSLVVTFRFLEGHNGLEPTDPWFARLRDAYLEPWGHGLGEAFEAAFRVGVLAHAFAWVRHRSAMPPEGHPAFDLEFAALLRWAMRRGGAGA
jgi:hypothetical protein